MPHPPLKILLDLEYMLFALYALMLVLCLCIEYSNILLTFQETDKVS